MTITEQMQAVLDQKQRDIERINPELRPEVIAKRKTEIQAWFQGEVDELLADGLAEAEAERVKAAKTDYQRRRKRGPQEGDWPEVSARSPWVRETVDGLELGAIPQHYQELEGLGDRLGAWLVQRHGLARLDGILTTPETDRESVTAAMTARDALAKSAWGNELVKHKAALSDIRKRENELRRLAGDDQQMLDDARARFRIRDYSNVGDIGVVVERARRSGDPGTEAA